MDHNTIRSRCYESSGTVQCIFHASLQDQAFDSGNDHEIICQLCLFAGCDLGTEVLDAVLSLLHIVSEEGIFLKSGLVLNNDGGNTHFFQCSHCVYEMLRQSAGISVKNNGLRGHFRHVINGTETGSHVHQLDIRLALRRGIAQRADPHGVELVQLAVMLHDGLLCDQPRQSAVYFQRLDNGTDLNELAQALSAVFRHGQLFLDPRINSFYFFIICIRDIYDLTAVCLQQSFHVVTDSLQSSLLPVIPMDHVVRAQFFNDLIIHYIILHDHIADFRDIFYQLHTLLEADGGKTVKTDHCRIT